MRKIAELLFQCYEKTRKGEVFSKDYEKNIEMLCNSLSQEQHEKLLNFETEIFETLDLRSIDVILFMLELLHSKRKWVRVML